MIYRALLFIGAILLFIAGGAYRVHTYPSGDPSTYVSRFHCAGDQCELTFYRVGSSGDPSVAVESKGDTP